MTSAAYEQSTIPRVSVATLASGAFDAVAEAPGHAPSSAEAGFARRHAHDTWLYLSPTIRRHKYVPAVTYAPREEYSLLLWRHLQALGKLYRSTAHPQPIARPHWVLYAENGAEELTIDEMSDIVDGATTLLNASNFFYVDRVLSSLNVKTMSVDAMVSIARITYLAREHLNSWESFVKSARGELERRGESEDNLEGLI